MIPVILLKGVEPVTAAKPSGGRRDHAFRLFPQLDPGDILSARVEAKLPDGSFKVMLAGQAMSMSLPAHVAAGDTLSLTFLAHEPRPTFALKDPPQATTSPPPLLSAAGRLVAATMLQPGELALPVAATTAAPLLAAPPTDGVRLSDALATTLAGTGLFYESHLAEWVSGARNLQQLWREPQARLARRAPSRQARVTIAAEAAADGPLSSAASATQPAPHQDQSIDPRTVPLVQQQLAAINDSKILLNLELWPGQWMQWEIGDEQPGTPHAAHTPQSWNTQLRLVLPQLGELKAALALDGERVCIRLETASAASAVLMREHRVDLQAALSTAGLPPAGITIAHHEQF